MGKNRGIYYVAIGVIFFICSNCAFAQLMIDEGATPSEKENKISLDIKGMDVVEVLKMLADKGNINIVIGGNVKGRVTMFLKDVNIRDAFDLILISNGLACDERNGIAYIMTDREYEQSYGTSYDDRKGIRIFQLKYANATEVSKALNQIKSKIGRIVVDELSNTIVVADSPEIIGQIVEFIDMVDKPTQSRVFELNYAAAKDLKDRIQDMLTKGVGRVQIDERTNKIIITDLENNLKKIEAVVKAFDTRQRQVLIEAKIIEITLSDTYKLGVDWEAVIREFQEQFKNIGIKGSFKLAAQGTLTPGAEILIGSFGSGDYAAMLQALQSVGDTNILSSPRITAMNNQEAKILVGSNEPYATNTVTQGTSTTTTATSLTFLDVGVKLYVTPTINQEGFVTIKIRPEVSSKSGDYTYGSPSTTVPIVSTTQAETSVMVKDGHTIIIAGLIKDNRAGTVNKVPILGDIPVLGTVFKKTDNSVSKKELVIFITPHIVSAEMDYLKQPLTSPIGEKMFTMSEKPTFKKRTPIAMDIAYLDKRSKRPKKSLDKEMDLQKSSPEDYFYFVRKSIVDNISIPSGASLLTKGDRVKVSFTVSSGGNLASTPTIVESTNEFFSGIVMAAVEKSAPFPVFPISIKESEKEFILDIVYEPAEEEQHE